MKRLFVLLALVPLVALADSWSYPPERTVSEHVFGLTRILRIVDATENQSYPAFSIEIYTSGELVGRYQGVSFEHIFTNSNEEVFVGLSNSGLPGTAMIVFDSRGTLRFLRSHRYDAELFDYCGFSVTLTREWFDESDPIIRFENEYGNDSLQIRGCNGSVITLLDLVARREE